LLERLPADGKSIPQTREPNFYENLLECLDCCLQKLEPRDRELILEYYVGEQRAKIESRRNIAAKLGLTINAVSIRACRIREKLEACMKTCTLNDE
jgi:DNA-directed RNA polymerase specialized sigma24 family protein